MGKEELVACFQDTLEQSNNESLKQRTARAVKSNRVYKEGFISKAKHRNENASIEVYSGTTFDVAKRYSTLGKIAVLNFANPENPGGGVQLGAMAQEECLCRSSNLYACISSSNVFDEYYGYHRVLRSHFYTDRLIYTKNVTVFKDDSMVPQMLPETDWFDVDVITCAAPYIAKRKYTNGAALFELFKSRIKNIFEAARENNVDYLILGAFGCGAFKNPPLIVAEAFRQTIQEENYFKDFKQIVFAIKPTGTNCPNLSAFSRQFDGYASDAYERCVLIPEPLKWRLRRCPALPIENRFSDNSKFSSWQLENKYFGKQFSILGDSISTLEGYIPKGYKVFYADDNCIKAGVAEAKDTWWGKVIDFFGSELLVNNSWSGSRVTKLPNKDDLFPSGCSEKRTGNLHIDSVNPDVIIVYLGTNDWANNISFWPEDLNHIDLKRVRHGIEMDKFEDAYMYMLWELASNYPDAEIWCCTLCETYISNRPDFQFPHKYAGTHIEAYNDCIRKISKEYNCKLLDLYNYHIPYDTVDGTHPNESGMNTIATLVLREMADEQGKSLLDCEKEQHDFVAVEEYTGGTRYVCSQCGKTIHKSNFPFVDCIDEQHEYEMYDQTGSYNYYKCKKCGKIKQECAWGEVLMNQEDIMQSADNNEKNKLEYVYAPPDITRILHSDNEIRLFDNNINQNLNIKKDKILVGRESMCDLQIEETAISRCQATFYFEDSVWYIADNNSKNGTWLNEKKLEPFKKYELIPGDVIDFAHQKQYVFFKSCDNKNNSNNAERAETALAVLEDAVVACRKSDFNDKNAIKLIAIALCQAPLYFPMEIDINAMFGNIDVENIKAGDVITPSQDVRMRFLTLNLDSEEVIPLFTSKEQIEKGPSVSTSRFYPQDYLPMLLESKKSIIINPFDENQVSFKYGFISDIVYPIFKGDIRESKEEKFDVGSVIDGKYELLAVVGQGVTFKVYLAKDIRLNKCWAVKVHDKKSRDSEIIMQMALQEVNMVKNLDHPAIPKIVDIVDNENYYCIVEEYVEGDTLEALVSKMGPQSVDLVVELGKQLCNALGYLHSLNPPHIYRDMKPANVMLKPDGNIKIIDFGIMRLYNAKATADENCLGTLGYASPEHFGGKGQTDARSDIYSLGVTLHRLLTGFNPSKDAPPPIRSINPNLPIELEHIISKCTQPNLNKRYQSCDELLVALKNIDNYVSPQKSKGILGKLFGKK